MQRNLVLKEGKSQFQIKGSQFGINPYQRAWLEIDLHAIESNTSEIKSILTKECLLMAVVKADGYGHGAINVAKATINGGANSLGIATLKEGIELREAGINCPILVLGNLVDKDELQLCVKWKLMPTINNKREALLYQEIANKKKQYLEVQIKVDTGMSRLGCNLSEASELFKTIMNCKYLTLKGIYSHLALADKDEGYSDFTSKQQIAFDRLLKKLPGIKDICCHLANSAGTLRNQTLHYDMVRVGLAIYGYSPIKSEENTLKLQPALSVKAKITLIRTVPKGTGISYGHAHVTKRESRLAVVGIGYADGINRSLSDKISVICNGHLCPQIGTITMDQLIIDITDFPDISIGDVITLLGRDGDYVITANQWGELSGSIPWEILCGFKNRLPRIFI